MPRTFNLSTAAKKVQAMAMNDLLGTASLDVYDGEQPEGADEPISPMNHILASFQLPESGGNIIEGGDIMLGLIPDTTWRANGKASFGRVSKAGLTLFDCSVGVANADIIINSNPVVAGAIAHVVAGAMYKVGG